MGQIVKIYLKDKSDENIQRFDDILKEKGIRNYFTSYADMKQWADDINTNPDSHQAHLKPITTDELIEMFRHTTEIGVMMFDVAYSRTSQEEASQYAELILKHVEDIEFVKNANDLISRYELSDDQIKVLKELNYEKPLPEKLPESEQYKPDLQGGLFLCKSYSPNPFWLIFGNVDKPTFLKEKIYVDEIYNNIYRDKNGYAYMLMPLMPINNRQTEFLTGVYDRAFDMGLREHYAFIMPVLYNVGLVNLIEVAKSYKEFYSQEELHKRFETLLRNVSTTHPYNQINGFVYRDRDKRFHYTSSDTIQAKCDVLTSLSWAIKNKAELAAIMSDVLKHKFSHKEFEKTP